MTTSSASPLWTALEHAQGKFERIVLSTNASMITRDAAARLRDLVDYVDITVDGPARCLFSIAGTLHIHFGWTFCVTNSVPEGAYLTFHVL